MATYVQSSRKRPGPFDPLHGRASGSFTEETADIADMGRGANMLWQFMRDTGLYLFASGGILFVLSGIARRIPNLGEATRFVAAMFRRLWLACSAHYLCDYLITL